MRYEKCNGSAHGDIPHLYLYPRCTECLCDHQEQEGFKRWICNDKTNIWIFPDLTYVEGSKPDENRN